jgi:hypothetical protein
MTAKTASLRVAAACSHCGLPLVSPEWSEPVGENQTVHMWHCVMCGNDFETVDNNPDRELTDQQVVEDLFPNLLVA